MSVQPALEHHHKRISWVSHSHLATPCRQGVTRRRGGGGVVSHDTSSASSKRTSDALKTTHERQKSQQAQHALQRLRNPGLKAPFLLIGLKLMSTIDPTLCPICHEPNICAMEKAKATGTKPERCWCMDAVFTPAVMDQVPDAAKGKACICAKCAETLN